MPDAYRVTIRLSPELYAQLTARGRQGQPLAAVVRQALADYLTRQPDEPTSAEDLAAMVAAMAARLQDLQDQMASLTARVDAMAATWQPAAASAYAQAADVPQVAASGQPVAADAPVLAAERQPLAATPQQQPRPSARHGLPRATLQAIADERTLCEGLSYREFAQRLFDKDIYRATAKDGTSVPANPGTVKKWLDQAREAGLL